MADTRKTIDKILTEIENANTEKAPQSNKNVKQVMEILLDRKIDSNESPIDYRNNISYFFDMNELRTWQEKNNQVYHVPTDYPLSSNKPVIGKLDVFLKKVVRKLIRPIICPIVTRQNEFNASVTASINALYNNELVTNAFIGEQESHNENQLKAELESLHNEVASLHNEIVSLKNGVTEDVYSVIDYNKFENYFRGTKEEIKNSQRQYIPYFEGKKNVVDLGCGRGEFLELLKESNINAIGVDAYSDFVEECCKKKLNAVQADALDYICVREDEELDGIFASQLAEHLKTADLAKLCQQAYIKLQIGGCFILETPNPTCLSTYTNAFYIDPTHNKPVHPKMLEYFLRDAGFTTVKIVYTNDSRVEYRLPLLNIEGIENLEEINNAINLLTDVIFGSQNYAIIAIK